MKSTVCHGIILNTYYKFIIMGFISLILFYEIKLWKYTLCMDKKQCNVYKMAYKICLSILSIVTNGFTNCILQRHKNTNESVYLLQ